MNVKGERVEVLHFERDERGEKVEAEQQPARVLLDVSAPVGLGGSSALDPSTPTNFVMPTFVSAEMTAQELAEGYSKPCHGCRHFDKRRAAEWYKRCQQSAEGMQVLNQFAAELPDLDTLGPEKAFSRLGVCGPMTELAQETMVVHPSTGCPSQITDYYGRKQPFGDHFVPDDRANERESANAYDQVLRTAEGKAP